MIGRRTSQGVQHFTPSELLNSCILYIYGYVQMRYRFVLHFLVFMFNHKHEVFQDRSGNPDHSETSNIQRDANRLITWCVNKIRGRRGSLWEHGESESFNFLETPTSSDKLSCMAYGCSNPSKDGVVKDWRQYPGVLVEPGPTGSRILTIQRPPLFSRFMPKQVTLEIVAPKVEGKSPEEVMRDLYRDIDRRQKAIAEKFEREGRKFMGVRRVLRNNPFRHTPHPQRYSWKRPRYATNDPIVREALEERDRSWLEAYEEAKAATKAGNTKVVFPYGTFKLVEYYLYPCQPAPG